MDGNWQQRLGRLTAAAVESEQVWRDDIKARDAAIREYDAKGMKLRELADATGLSVSQISRIVCQPRT